MMRVNPFFELYVGDRMSSREFVDIFSPFLVHHAEALFLPGNVVLKGVQGSGKSMLLTLLKPDVRLEYVRANEDFPVLKALRKFIGAGINLAHENAIDFGYRRISNDPNETALFFADFVNYTVLLDLLISFQKLGSSAEVARELGIELADEQVRAFVAALAASDVFHGSLVDCASLDSLEVRIKARLNAYRRFLHHNDQELTGGIRDTKTDIGTPLKVAVELLKANGLVGHDVTIFIHFDQYEELANISETEENSPDYRRVINRALARRDPTLSYRIGTRGHAWRNHGFVLGTHAKLEEERDYKFVDLDLMLRRNENRRTWIFPSFVADVFVRRLVHVGLASKGADGGKLLEDMLGPGMSPADKARRYGGRSPKRSVKIDEEWPARFKDDLFALADQDPLSARLLESWILQTIERGSTRTRHARINALTIGLLDEMQKSEWWVKERLELGLTQIAARCQERPIWCGRSEVVDLSGGGILTFLSLCQFIWDTHNQLGVARTAGEVLPRIDDVTQAIGVFKASDHWLKKITAETGRSGDRFRLVRQAGTVLARHLYADRQMSYPGHNAFSLADEELERYPHVKSLLDEMTDYGTMTARPHTTKEKDRRSRTKFALSPILCPQFKMHYKIVKEPFYLTPQTIEEWMDAAGLSLPETYRRRAVREDAQTLPLFDGGPES
jgi:hypothetical protein